MTPGSLVTALGYAAGGLVFYLATRRHGQASERMGWIALWALAGGVAGARLTEWLIGHQGVLAEQPGLLFDPRLGGRTLLGGIGAGWLALIAAKRILGVTRPTGDLFALALPAGEAVGRLGCLLNGCCYGVAVPKGSLAMQWAIYQHGAWRHPSQLYAAVAAITLFCFLLPLSGKLPRPGDLFKLYLLLFGASRFLIEFWRERELAWAGLSLAQWVCLGLIGWAGFALWKSWRPTPSLQENGPRLEPPETVQAGRS